MRIRTVDAFTDHPFTGNPAGVLLFGPEGFPEDGFLQRVAAELNLSETAFAHPLPPGGDADWALRWFTPVAEVDMCGHATLATAHVLHTTGTATGTVRFAARCGTLTSTAHADGSLTLDFPTAPLTPEPAPAGLAEALGADPVSVHDTGPHVGDLLVELKDEAAVRGWPRTSRRWPASPGAASSPRRRRSPAMGTTTSRGASSPPWASTRTR